MTSHGANAAEFSLAEFLPYRIVALGRRISKELSYAYEHENLTIPEWRVLAVLGEERSMAARDVAARTPMDKMAVSRAVASLEAKGMLERGRSPGDRRVRSLALSEKGAALYARIAPLAAQFQRQLLAALGEERARALQDSLDRIEESLSDAENRR
jgi:DNA-binding MarR family transcriptional regulator